MHLQVHSTRRESVQRGVGPTGFRHFRNRVHPIVCDFNRECVDFYLLGPIPGRKGKQETGGRGQLSVLNEVRCEMETHDRNLTTALVKFCEDENLSWLEERKKIFYYVGLMFLHFMLWWMGFALILIIVCGIKTRCGKLAGQMKAEQDRYVVWRKDWERIRNSSDTEERF